MDQRISIRLSIKGFNNEEPRGGNETDISDNTSSLLRPEGTKGSEIDRAMSNARRAKLCLLLAPGFLDFYTLRAFLITNLIGFN